MTQHLHERFESWFGRTLTDAAGHEVGTIEDIYTDDDTGQPEWLAVVTGHHGSNVSFVPLAGATDSGDDVQVQFPEDQVKAAPNAGRDGKLSEAEEARLYAHYGMDYDQERVRLQRWVDRERTGAAPIAYEADREREPMVETAAPLPLESREAPHADALRGDDVTREPYRPMAPSWADDEEIDGDDRLLAPRTEPVEVGLHQRR